MTSVIRLTNTSFVTRSSTDGHDHDIHVRDGAPHADAPIGRTHGGASRMHRLTRLIGLAAASAAVITSLTAGAAFAAGSATIGHVYVNNNTAGRNTVAGFDRHADGSLTAL